MLALFKYLKPFTVPDQSFGAIDDYAAADVLNCFAAQYVADAAYDAKTAAVERALQSGFQRAADYHAAGLAKIDLTKPDLAEENQTNKENLELTQIAILEQCEAYYGSTTTMLVRRRLGLHDPRQSQFFQ